MLTPAPAADGARVRSPQLNKLDSHLQALVRDRRAGRSLQRAAKRRGVDVSGGRVLVDVYVRGNVRTAAARLRTTGMRVGATSNRGALRIVEGRLPVQAAVRAAALSRVRAVVSVPPPLLSVGAKTSQGDAAHHGPQARALGPTGAGVDVGIISDSINQVGTGVAQSQSTGDLPSNVTVLSDNPGGTDEGRAMAEIAYDTAPGIPRILFASAFAGGPVEKAASIDSLVAAGADVIADDTSFLNEPFFQDGVVGRAVDRARASGTVYIASAGNQARQSWEGTFRPSNPGPGGGPLHDFQSGAATDTVQEVVSVSPGRTISTFLQWDEAYGQAQTDLDVFLVDAGTNAVIGTPGDSDNISSGIPFDGATYTNPGPGSVDVGVAIERFAGTRTPFMKYIATGNFGTFTIGQYPTNSDAIAPDAATARGSITVGAVRASEPGLDDPEGFSSRGPKTILFDSAGNRLATPEVRQKPELAAADGVSTTVPGFDPFSGTSAAAPSAAGVAALLRSAKPSLGPDAIKAIMTDPRATNDCNPAGEPDAACGFGFVFADNATQSAFDSTPPVVTAQLAPPAPNGLNGFYTSDVGVSWALSDPESPIFASSGCGATTVGTDTAGTTLNCSATSAGGTTSRSAAVKRDASPPTAPSFSGIAPRTYQRVLLPPAPAQVIGCTATDPTSGIDPTGCQVSGYTRNLGTHSLLGTVRNNAGLTTARSLSYTVIPTKPAIAALSAPRKIKLKSILRSGLLARVTVGRSGTRLTADLLGPGGVRLGKLTRTAGAGRRALRIRLSRKGKARTRNRSRSVVKLLITGRPLVGAPRTLRRRVAVRA